VRSSFRVMLLRLAPWQFFAPLVSRARVPLYRRPRTPEFLFRIG